MSAKYRVEITATAQVDVEEIWSFISHDSPTRANSFIRQLEEQTASLEKYPLRCPLISENEILGTRYRHFIYGDYRTIFEVKTSAVVILRIIHGSRLLDVSLFE